LGGTTQASAQWGRETKSSGQTIDKERFKDKGGQKERAGGKQHAMPGKQTQCPLQIGIGRGSMWFQKGRKLRGNKGKKKRSTKKGRVKTKKRRKAR